MLCEAPAALAATVQKVARHRATTGTFLGATQPGKTIARNASSDDPQRKAETKNPAGVRGTRGLPLGQWGQKLTIELMGASGQKACKYFLIWQFLS
jgi:hypothetical protein